MRDEPAFPVAEIKRDGLYIVGGDGLSKREYFAGLAMQGILAGCDLNGLPELPDMQNSDLAKCSVAAADALIKELERE